MENCEYRIVGENQQMGMSSITQYQSSISSKFHDEKLNSENSFTALTPKLVFLGILLSSIIVIYKCCHDDFAQIMMWIEQKV